MSDQTLCDAERTLAEIDARSRSRLSCGPLGGGTSVVKIFSFSILDAPAGSLARGMPPGQPAVVSELFAG